MTGFLYLSGENPPLARAELLSAYRALGAKGEPVEFQDRIALIEQKPSPELVDRLGMCHFAGVLERTCPPEMERVMAAVEGTIEMLDPELSLAPLVRMPRGILPFTAEELFNGIAEAIGGAGRKLRLRSPDSKVFVVVAKEAFVGHTTHSSSRSELMSRRGSNLAFSRPVMMDPRVSRSMVNLLGLPVGSSILDPFMGPGGLIMEAALLGYECTGIEVDLRVLEGAFKNLDSKGLTERVRAHLGDSRSIRSIKAVTANAPFDGLLTDPPFGRSASSGGSEPGDLLRVVLTSARELLVNGAPVVLDAPDERMLDRVEGYELSSILKFRVHKSLTRHICVLRVVR
ncbi:MAG: RsmD family RNA methyltransferase [Candidatus Thermoplasmatota archaeon]|jgi:tRNA (guanine10-N2)-dimethyltransferase|nr:RsmD family RNA methyltransferase [Candidatus Thermoplasmatota archaeon]